MLNRILNLIFPAKCVHCGRVTHKGFLCPDCEREYENEISLGCLSCGKQHERCTCDSRYLNNEKMIYVVPYKSEGVSRDMLLRIKTLNARAIVSHLTDKMASALRSNGVGSDYIITYVPRSPTKIRIEGVDQAKLLARSLAEKTGLKLEKLFLCAGGVKEQKSLEYSERDVFARSRFSLILGAEERIKGKKIVLVDDIITSGATVKVCSDMLTDAGATDVVCLSAGRSVKY